MTNKIFNVYFRVANTFECEFNTRMFFGATEYQLTFTRCDEDGTFSSDHGMMCVDLSSNKITVQYDCMAINGIVLSTKKIGDNYRFEVATDFFKAFIYAMTDDVSIDDLSPFFS